MKGTSVHLPPSQPSRKSRVISYEKDGYRFLVSLLGKDIDISNWKYTVKGDKVYVKGADGFLEWNRKSPRDSRNVVILNIP